MKQIALGVVVALSAIVIPNIAVAACPAGYVTGPRHGGCIPAGADDCNATYYCVPGWHCCRDAETCRRASRNWGRDGCYPGPEAAAKLYIDDQQKRRDARHAAEQQKPPPSATAAHCEQLLAPGAWAFETQCVQGSNGGPSSTNSGSSGPNRDARDNWIRESINELARDLGSLVPADQLPPSGSVVASATPQGTLPAGPQAGSQSLPGSAAPQDQRAALPADQSSTGPSGDQCPPAIPASFWQNGLNADYCAKASASCVDRGSAYYGYMCAPDPDAAAADLEDPVAAQRLHSTFKKMRRTFKPPMSPQALRALAFTACQDKSLTDKPQCIEDFEVGLLLGADGDVLNACASIADSIARHNKAVDEGPGPDWLKAERQWVCGPDPDVRAACAAITDRKARLDCVDAVYVNGPANGSDLRQTLERSLRNGSSEK